MSSHSPESAPSNPNTPTPFRFRWGRRLGVSGLILSVLKSLTECRAARDQVSKRCTQGGYRLSASDTVANVMFWYSAGIKPRLSGLSELRRDIHSLPGFLSTLWKWILKHLSDFTCPSRKPDPDTQRLLLPFSLQDPSAPPATLSSLGMKGLPKRTVSPTETNPKPTLMIPFQSLWPLSQPIPGRLSSTYEATSGLSLPSPAPPKEMTILPIRVEIYASMVHWAYAVCYF